MLFFRRQLVVVARFFKLFRDYVSRTTFLFFAA